MHFICFVFQVILNSFYEKFASKNKESVFKSQCFIEIWLLFTYLRKTLLGLSVFIHFLFIQNNSVQNEMRRFTLGWKFSWFSIRLHTDDRQTIPRNG